MELVVAVVVVVEVVERLEVECGRGESGVSGESESASDQAGEEDVDSVSVGSRVSLMVDESLVWRLGSRVSREPVGGIGL